MRIMANHRQFSTIIDSAEQLFVAANHVATGNGILRTIDKCERHIRLLQCRYPALSVLYSIPNISNQIMKNMLTIVVVDVPPEIRQLLLRRLGVSAKYRAETSAEFSIAIKIIEPPTDWTQQKFLNQERTMSLRE